MGLEQRATDSATSGQLPVTYKCDLNICKSETAHWPPQTVQYDGNEYNLESIFRSLGIHLAVRQHSVPLPDHPRGLATSLSDLHDLLQRHKSDPEKSSAWRANVLIVPSIAYCSNGRVRRPLGIMFDIGAADSGHPASEGCAIAWRLVSGSPILYLRTLAHEIGHLFNLLHPHEDEPPVYAGDTLMFETRHLVHSRRFPENVRLQFSDANIAWVRESPEGFVRPGGTPYGSRPGISARAVGLPTDHGADFGVAVDLASLTLRLRIVETTRARDLLPWLPLELEVELQVGRQCARTWPVDLDPAAGSLSVEMSARDGGWTPVRPVVRDCGAPRVMLRPGHSLRQTVMLPTLCLTDDLPRAIRVHYRAADRDCGNWSITSDELVVRARLPRSAAERAVCQAATDFDLRLAACWRGFPGRCWAAYCRLEALGRSVDLATIAPRLALLLAASPRGKPAVSSDPISIPRAPMHSAPVAEHVPWERETGCGCC
jgi:hypothetical protein